MINAVSEVLSNKTIDQYKIIEDRYETLKRYLILYTEKHRLMSWEEVELIIKALENEPIEETKEEEINE
jgi:hypothetical protein